jgi:glutamine synthetase
MLVMETLKRVAPRHGMQCILHEKPFAGINGSGKHLNWSMATNTGDQPPRPARRHAHQHAVPGVPVRRDPRSGPARRPAPRQVASANNDHRLGANEAPPAIMSIFLGDMLSDIIDQLESGAPKKRTMKGGKLDLGSRTLPRSPPHGRPQPHQPVRLHRQQVRVPCRRLVAVGAWPATVLNTIVAESLDYLATQLEKSVGARTRSTQRSSRTSCRRCSRRSSSSTSG